MPRKTERVNTDTTAAGARGGAPASEHVHAVAPCRTAKPGPSLSRIQIPQRAQMNPIQRQTTNSLDLSARRSHCRIANIAQVDSRNASAPVPIGNPANTVG
jgi:hypothetical protein